MVYEDFIKSSRNSYLYLVYKLLSTGTEAEDLGETVRQPETEQATAAQQRAERLAAKLRELGLDPDELV